MTTTLGMLKAIQSEIISDAVGFTEPNTIIVAQRVFVPWSRGSIYCQVHPSTLTRIYRVGGVKYAEQQVGTSVFAKLRIDQRGEDSERLTNDTLGLLQAVDKINEQLEYNRLGLVLIDPMSMIRMEAPTSGETQDADGWAAITTVWNVGYEVTYA